MQQLNSREQVKGLKGGLNKLGKTAASGRGAHETLLSSMRRPHAAAVHAPWSTQQPWPCGASMQRMFVLNICLHGCSSKNMQPNKGPCTPCPHIGPPTCVDPAHWYKLPCLPFESWIVIDIAQQAACVESYRTIDGSGQTRRTLRNILSGKLPGALSS